MRTIRNQTEGAPSPSITEALNAKDTALKAAMAYIESQGGPFEWCKSEQAYRTHQLVKRALETHSELRNNHNGYFCLSS
jgi:hypothetical protein